MGKLGGLQSEHQALRFRTLLIIMLVKFGLTLGEDTGLSELLLPFTQKEHFNKSLEIQQSKCLVSEHTTGFVENTHGQIFLRLTKSIIKS